MLYIQIARERLTPTVSTPFTAANIPRGVSGGSGTQNPPRTEYVVIQSIGGDIHFQTDGNAATTAAGLILPENSKVEVWGAEAMDNFRCIDDGGSEELECQYMGRS